MDKVRIYIVAGPNQGKTTIAHIIKDALANHDINKVNIIDTKSNGEHKDPIEVRMKATQERPVCIEVVSTAEPLRVQPFPAIIAREWLKAAKNARSQISLLGSQADAVNQAHLRELDGLIEELQIFTR